MRCSARWRARKTRCSCMTDETKVPDVSVVIPCYNAERWVARAIDSVLAQEGVTVEVIVIDDGSTDGSVDVLRRYEDRIHWETGPNRGACAARNRGLALARADYVMFLDADDYIGPELLASMQQSITEHGADCAIAQVFDQSEHGPMVRRTRPRTDDWRHLLEDWLRGAFVPPCGLLWRRCLVEKIDGWNAQLRKNQDGDLVYRAILDGAAFCTTAEGHAVYWHHAGGRISSNLSRGKLLDALATMQTLTAALESRGELTGPLRRAVSLSSHTLERRAVELTDPALSRDLADFRRSYGFPRYDGSTLHIATSKIIGLPRKQKISRILQGLQQKLKGRRILRESEAKHASQS
ncbi:MAG: glycosyltransferase [Spiribacter salinus]|uniref:Glycosyltransferase n=1 Tax=Spiribacter salinus TaxID=1335746 RepID=A0A540VNR1_9GAMM|nr:MAG: glycosyltransferase [Spiribacter salinus]